MGAFFGYPKCCIDQFLTDVDEIVHGRDPRTDLQKHIAFITRGYVPCPECAKRIYAEDDLLVEEINKRRHPDAGKFVINYSL